MEDSLLPCIPYLGKLSLLIFMRLMSKGIRLDVKRHKGGLFQTVKRLIREANVMSSNDIKFRLWLVVRQPRLPG